MPYLQDFDDSSLRLDGISADQGVQFRLGHRVVLILVLVITVIVIVVTAVHQVDDQDRSLAHGIQLKSSLQDLVSIEDARGEVKIDISIFERETDFTEMLVMFICQLLLFRFRIGSVEDENAFAER